MSVTTACVCLVTAACTHRDQDATDSSVTTGAEHDGAPEGTAPPEATAPGDAPSSPANPGFEVVALDGETIDADRDRRIPYRVYAPVGQTGPTPVVLVSHRGRGSERGYRSGGHLGKTLAAGGYVAVHVGHLRSARGDRQLDDRPADVSYLLDQLDEGALVLPARFGGTVDTSRVGHTGHSFGAYTAHALGGATFERTYTDSRIDAIAPISPQGPDQFGAFDHGPGDSTWSTVTIPAYNLVGGEEADMNVVGTIKRTGWRLVPFESYPERGDKFLTVIAGQDHSDMWSSGSQEVERFIAEQILRFFDVYLDGDPSVDPCTIGVGELTAAETSRRASSVDTLLADCP